eukprot:2807734-Pyramimonas_sp.AAC.1
MYLFVSASSPTLNALNSADCVDIVRALPRSQAGFPGRRAPPLLVTRRGARRSSAARCGPCWPAGGGT